MYICIVGIYMKKDHYNSYIQYNIVIHAMALIVSLIIVIFFVIIFGDNLLINTFCKIPLLCWIMLIPIIVLTSLGIRRHRYS